MFTFSHKKGQSAREFLTTYGWAFLVILIMIGALAYFGILDPSKILPDRCNFGSEFDCQDFQMSASDGTIRLRMQNNVGSSIDVRNVTIYSDADNQFLCDGANKVASSAPHPGRPNDGGPVNALNRSRNGGIIDWIIQGCDAAYSNVGYEPGVKEKLLINIQWFDPRSGVNYIHETRGEIFATLI